MRVLTILAVLVFAASSDGAAAETGDAERGAKVFRQCFLSSGG